MRRGAAIGVLAAGLACAATERGARADLVGPDGHVAKTSFDPGSGLALGAVGLVDVADGASPAARQAFTIGLRLRGERSSGEGKAFVSWQLRHRVFETWIGTQKTTTADSVPFDATLYRLTALRHDLSPSLVVPSSPPWAVPFPFDVGFDVAVGRAEAPVAPAFARDDGAPRSLYRVDVVGASLLLDPWRSGARGRFFTVGVGARYGLDVYGPQGLAAPTTVHRVAPMTDASAHLHVESADGLWMLDASAEAAPEWRSDGRWAFFAGSTLRLERTLLGLNDQPIGLALDAAANARSATRDLAAQREVRAGLGLVMRLGG